MGFSRNTRLGANIAALCATGFLVACKPEHPPLRDNGGVTAAAGANTATENSAGDADFSRRFPLRIGMKRFTAQVALSQIETSGGLMGREKLDADEGMLFVFRESGPREFWMRNVPIPLALGYITGDGRLDEIKVMEAQNPEPVPSRSERIQFVLEMRQGWFDANNVRPGDALDLSAVRAAVKARGFPLKNYGL